MTALPAALGGGDDLVVWRLEERTYAATWDSGEGPFLYGGRWNSKGVRVVYCALDPAVAILEVAVHTGFRTLDTVPYVLTAARIADIAEVQVVTSDARAKSQLVATGDSERGPAGVRRRLSSSPPLRGDSERGLHA